MEKSASTKKLSLLELTQCSKVLCDLSGRKRHQFSYPKVDHKMLTCWQYLSTGEIVALKS